MPGSEDVKKVREQADAAVVTAAEQARTPLLAALGAGDLAAKAVVDLLGKVRERVTEGAEAARVSANGLPQDFDELRQKLDPAELRKLVDAYTQAALQLYGHLAERGEATLDRLRARPEVQRAWSQVETGVESAQERVEHVVDDVRELADDVLGKVTRTTRSVGEKAANATEQAAEDLADATKEQSDEIADAVLETGAKAGSTVRSTARKAANRAAQGKSDSAESGAKSSTRSTTRSTTKATGTKAASSKAKGQSAKAKGSDDEKNAD
ncbi:heparin binding hemagglutinin HbhA [Actinoalloteichus hymeniacidonis]|nr:heparin binding hemagglutinin HbhA [Actinoalloteichus hymeniacidonis]